jgi:D-3-phosphoglycerate dehydrogenase
MKQKILIATASFGELDPTILDKLQDSYECVFNQTGRKLTSEELSKLIVDVEGIIAGTEQYSKDILGHAKNLKVISRVGIGIDNIDLDFCQEANIAVLSTKTDLSYSVAELVITQILSFYRNIPSHHKDFKENLWKRKMGETINGKTLGIIGLGKIGKRLVEITSGFNLELLACDLYRDEDFAKKYSIEYCDMDYLCSNAEIISIHANSKNSDKHLISRDQISLMNTKTLLINTSRGNNVDELALLEALKNNAIAGACLDVFKSEPYKGEFTSLENVILTPHIGGYTSNVRKDLETEAVENLRKSL